MPRVNAPLCAQCKRWWPGMLRLYVRGENRQYKPIGWVCPGDNTIQLDLHESISAVRKEG